MSDTQILMAILEQIRSTNNILQELLRVMSATKNVVNSIEANVSTISR